MGAVPDSETSPIGHLGNLCRFWQMYGPLKNEVKTSLEIPPFCLQRHLWDVDTPHRRGKSLRRRPSRHGPRSSRRTAVLPFASESPRRIRTQKRLTQHQQRPVPGQIRPSSFAKHHFAERPRWKRFQELAVACSRNRLNDLTGRGQTSQTDRSEDSRGIPSTSASMSGGSHPSGDQPRSSL